MVHCIYAQNHRQELMFAHAAVVLQKEIPLFYTMKLRLKEMKGWKFAGSFKLNFISYMLVYNMVRGEHMMAHWGQSYLL